MLRLTEDASFRRRVMAETGTHTTSTIGTPLLLRWHRLDVLLDLYCRLSRLPQSIIQNPQQWQPSEDIGTRWHYEV